jgi:NNP family nitrate/nitrite transporter-like MFS transporter
MNIRGTATRIRLLSIDTPPMRAFHVTWFAFFLCFFGWFGIAPLMAVVREDLQLTAEQVANTIIASTALTIVARLFVGWLCDRIGPRRAYTWLLVAGSLPVMGIGLAHNYETFLLFRFGIGMVGASFVITQFHTSLMFAPNVVGAANATAAGWGNLGGGVTQFAMPLLLGALVSLGLDVFTGWRVAMVVPGILMLATAVAYSALTQDAPEGNFAELRASGVSHRASATASFLSVCRDYRVWLLFALYGACFGIELTIDNMAALYFRDRFQLGLKAAGIVASSFGLMNVFARALGGIVGDAAGRRWGLKGRSYWLGTVIFMEGISLITFARLTAFFPAVAVFMLFGILVCMGCGATYAVTPFINRQGMGAVAGIVGAGGNAGAVAAGLLLKMTNVTNPDGLIMLGTIVAVFAFLAPLVRFSRVDDAAIRREMTAPNVTLARAFASVGGPDPDVS